MNQNNDTNSQPWVMPGQEENVWRFSIYWLWTDWRGDDNLMYTSVSEWIHFEMNSIFKLETLPHQIGLICINWDRSEVWVLSLSSPADNGELNVCNKAINNPNTLIGKAITGREGFQISLSVLYLVSDSAPTMS